MEAPAHTIARLTGKASLLSPATNGLMAPPSADNTPGLLGAIKNTVQQAVKGSVPRTQTSNFGCPFDSTSRSLNIAGHPIVSDVMLMEKQQMFNRTKIVERMVHPCGAGAFGFFETTKDMSRYCKASFLNGIGTQTPVFCRFSTVTFGKEFPDEGRNPRGFALKFYTGEGNYDLVGLNFPVFFVRDPAQGPDVIRSQQRNPRNFLLDYDSLVDFIANVPESMHAATMFFSDDGTPDGFRHMHGYGCHTFKWVNAAGEEFFIKYTFLSEAGRRNLSWEQAVRTCGEDPDYSKRDLYNHIEKGKEACWKAYVQIMPAADAAQYKWDPFDVTKVWPRSDYPLQEFGRLVLNRNPENYHRDVEQAAFSPGSYVPGIEPSPDALLQFRSFFYRDAQMYRLGANMHQIPVNCPFMTGNYNPPNRDGAMRCDDNGGTDPHYFPNSSQAAPAVDPSKGRKPYPVSGVLARGGCYKHEGHLDEELAQPRELYTRVMSDAERANLHRNIAVVLKWVDVKIQKKFLNLCYKIDPAYAQGIMAHLDSKDLTLDAVR